MIDLESVAVELVANSGAAKSSVMEALRSARMGNYSEAEKLMVEADQCLLEAHKAQTSLIHSEAKGELKPDQIGILMVHAQDHLMTTILAQDLVREIILLHKKIDGQS